MEDTSFILQRKRQKNLRMHFNDKGQLIVSVPLHTPESRIKEFVENNARWIEETGAKFRTHTFRNGDTVPYLGKDCLLLVIKGPENGVRYLDNSILVSVKGAPADIKVRKLLKAFYEKTISEKVFPRLEYWCSVMDLPIPRLETGNAKTRWAVCIPAKKTIRFSALAAALDEDLIDMITAHELCHFFHANHGQSFKSKLRSFVPDADKKEKRLRAVGISDSMKNLF